MLHGWAEQENLATVKMLYQVLQKEELVEPDIGTYGALLHAYGKFADKDGIKKILQDLEDKVIHTLFLRRIQTRIALELASVQYCNTYVVYEDILQFQKS